MNVSHNYFMLIFSFNFYDTSMVGVHFSHFIHKVNNLSQVPETLTQDLSSSKTMIFYPIIHMFPTGLALRSS